MSQAERIKVAVIGAGRFGARRVEAAMANPRSQMRVVADPIVERARHAAQRAGCDHTTDWEHAIVRKDVDAVIVSTPTRFLPVIAKAALEAGKHVLCEKPFGRTPDEVLPVVEEAGKRNLRLKIGFNHRYHPAIERAHSLLQENAVGRVLFLRCLYGHGGRPGYEKEWRARAELSGGGQLLDQGVHALDLFRWFLGDFEEVTACRSTLFWPIAPLEDNLFALLRTGEGRVASLHASWTNWKNIFSFEIFGESGYLTVTGLGGNYGTERLCWGRRHALGEKPQERWFEFNGQDRSLEREWSDFLDCLLEGREPQTNGRDGWQTLRLAEAIYDAAREARTVYLERDGDQAAPVQFRGEKQE